jgi:hypothetical protein
LLISLQTSRAPRDASEEGAETSGATGLSDGRPNTHPFNEGRNFYQVSVAEFTRRWHEVTGSPLLLVSGSDALASATAFYSPEHPEFRMAWNPQDSWAPSRATLDRGWGAICFSDEVGSLAFMDRTATPSRSVRSEFTVQSTLMGIPGATRRVTVLIVPPEKEEDLVRGSDKH